MGIKRKLFVTVLLAIAAMPLSAQSTVAHEIVKTAPYLQPRQRVGTVEAINEANPNIGVRSLVIGETLMIPVPMDTLMKSLTHRYRASPIRKLQNEVYLVKKKRIHQSL